MKAGNSAAPRFHPYLCRCRTGMEIIMVNMIELTEEMKKELAFTEEELKELENARKMPITFDEDCPETTPERAVRFRRVNPKRTTTGAPA